ncbi:hypothetical protein PABG_00576 [Paracoccidioides brasiliensis Pb03]|nr:hypothetical protein PABG_00576 [Paracoccidioides brasiliensis Pb03]
MNQAPGLTHLPGSHLQQARPVSPEKTSASEADDQPSAASDASPRQQSLDSLFAYEGTPVEQPWGNQFMDSLYCDGSLISYDVRHNPSASTKHRTETGPVHGNETLALEATLGTEDIPNPKPVTPTGNQHGHDITSSKRSLDEVENLSHLSDNQNGNDTRPSKMQHIERNSPSREVSHTSTVTSVYLELENDQPTDVSAFPPNFQFPELPEIPGLWSSFELPGGCDFNPLNANRSTDSSGSHDAGFPPSTQLQTTIPHHHQIARLDENPSNSGQISSPEDGQMVGSESEATISTSCSSNRSSMTSLSIDQHEICTSDRDQLSLDRLNGSHPEREQPPDSLFGDGTFPIDIFLAEEISKGNDTRHLEGACPVQNKSAHIQFVENDITKNFNLGPEDILATQYREIFRHVPKPEEYISPYPKKCGPLGYFPSTPVLHTRCIEVAPEDVAKQLKEYHRKLQKVTSERSRYKNAWIEWKTVDPATGKNKEQKLKDEPFRLKRALMARERKSEALKKETEHWRSQFSNLALAYNELVKHLNMLQASQIPQHLTVVAQPHPGHPTPVPSPVPSPQPEHGTATLSVHPPPDPQTPVRPTSQLAPVTIDSTDDEPSNQNTNNPTSPPSDREERSRIHRSEELRNALLRKEYQWLGNKRHRYRPILPAIPCSGHGWRPESTSGLHRNLLMSNPTKPPNKSTGTSIFDHPENSRMLTERASCKSNAEDDELAQMLDTELDGSGPAEG